MFYAFWIIWKIGECLQILQKPKSPEQKHQNSEDKAAEEVLNKLDEDVKGYQKKLLAEHPNFC